MDDGLGYSAAKAEMVRQAGSLALSIEILPLFTYLLCLKYNNTFNRIPILYYHPTFHKEGRSERLSNSPKVL